MSKIIPRFKAFIKQGKIVWGLQTKQKFDSYLFTLKDDVSIIVKPWQEKTARSKQQNKYYWGVVIDLLSDHLGYSTEETHEICKQKFLCKRIELEGRVFYIGKDSTRILTTKAMEEYLEEIRMWAAELEVNIPLPNEIEEE